MFSQDVRDNNERVLKIWGDCLPDCLEIRERVCLVLELEVFVTVCVIMVEAGKAAPLAVREVGLGLMRLLRLLLAARVPCPFRGLLGLALVAVCVGNGIYVPLGGHSAYECVEKNTETLFWGLTLRLSKQDSRTRFEVRLAGR